MEIKVINKTTSNSVAYALYKVYPLSKGNFRFKLGFFKNPFDYEAEARWYDKHEHDEQTWFEADRIYYDVLDPKTVVDSEAFRAKCVAYVKRKMDEYEERSRRYDKWKEDLALKGIDEHSLPLSERYFPKLFGGGPSPSSFYDDIRYGLVPELVPSHPSEVEIVNRCASSSSSRMQGTQLTCDSIKTALRYLYN